MTSPHSPAVLRLENRHTGEVLEIERRRRNGESSFVLRGTLPAHRQGPPIHVHLLEDEEGLVVSGTLSAEVGGRRVTVPSGQAVRLPRGVPHRWWNDGDEELRFEGVTSPAVDLDRYLHAIFEVLNAGPAARPPLFYLAHLSLRHRHSQRVLLLPAVIQTLLFGLIVAVGTALGRYRGTDWPGCPARCTGAQAEVTGRRPE